MTALGDCILICAVGFVLVAALSLLIAKPPAIPQFARRSATAGSTQLRQDANAHFLHDRGFLFRMRTWFVGTCCPPVRVESSNF
jgi:5-methylcytosine-specific restriction endonuclease McrA